MKHLCKPRRSEIIRGPLRLVQPVWNVSKPWSPQVRTVQEEIVRLLTTAARINERERLKALRQPPPEE